MNRATGIENLSAATSLTYDGFIARVEKYLPVLSVLFFLVGIAITRMEPSLGASIDKGMSLLISAYGYVAPVAIFLILAPALTKILQVCEGNGRRFITDMLLWFVKTRLLACVWAVVFTTIVFGLPIYINHTVTFGSAFLRTGRSLGWMLSHSPYFYAIYASLVTVFAAHKVKQIAHWLEGCAELVERLGGYFVPIVPLFMFAIGSYVTYLPTSLNARVGDGANVAHLNTLTVFGFRIQANTAAGMIGAYAAGALLTGLACLMWHFGLILVAKYRVRDFSIIGYFRNYWVRVYPLLWSTSSEALATPLNLHLVKKHYPRISGEIRGFVIGGGSFLGINGTIICVFVLAGLVAGLLGIQISFLQLLLGIPAVFLIGYGVPGIPGELLLFGGPMVTVLGVAPETAPTFLALYVGLQIGLPDSFRTGANSTDNCVNGVILQNIYNKKYLKAKEPPVLNAPADSLSQAPDLTAESF